MRNEGTGMRDEAITSGPLLSHPSSLIPHPSVTLSGELPLGQALIKLAATPDEAAVSVDGGIHLAKSLRARILADLEMAANDQFLMTNVKRMTNPQ